MLIYVNNTTGILKYKSKQVTLTIKEGALLNAFINTNSNDIEKVKSREKLIQDVWKERCVIISNKNLLQLMYQLREKLKKLTGERLIINIFKRGYIIIDKVKFFVMI